MSKVRVIKHNEATVSVRERIAHGIDCAHCTAESLVIVNGTVTWKSAHRENGSLVPHANAISMSALLKIYLTTANAAMVKDVRKMVEEFGKK